MRLKFTSMMLAAAMLVAGPVEADHDDDDWEERYQWHEPGKKGKGKRKGWEKQDRGYYIIYVPLYAPPPASLAPEQRQSPPKTGPRDFPRESHDDRARATDRQRGILEKELATEQELLALARRELAEQEGKTGPDAGQLLPAYKENVQLHERNVAALQRELGRIRR